MIATSTPPKPNTEPQAKDTPQTIATLTDRIATGGETIDSRKDEIAGHQADNGMEKPQEAAPRKPRKPAIEKMNAALLAEFYEIVAILGRTERSDVLARYDIAQRLQRICEGDGRKATYGQGAVRKLAQALGQGWKKSQIYNYARVAKTWPVKEEFKALVDKTGTDGLPLTWSHFLALARVTDVDRREKLMMQALEKGWPASQLRSRISGKVPFTYEVLTGKAMDGATQREAPQAKIPKELDVALGNYVTPLVAARDDSHKTGRRLDRLIRDAPPDDLGGAVLERLKQARGAIGELCGRQAALLDTLIARVEAEGKATVRSQDEWASLPPDSPRDRQADEPGEHAEGPSIAD